MRKPTNRADSQAVYPILYNLYFSILYFQLSYACRYDVYDCGDVGHVHCQVAVYVALRLLADLNHHNGIEPFPPAVASYYAFVPLGT